MKAKSDRHKRVSLKYYTGECSLQWRCDRPWLEKRVCDSLSLFLFLSQSLSSFLSLHLSFSLTLYLPVSFSVYSTRYRAFSAATSCHWIHKPTHRNSSLHCLMKRLTFLVKQAQSIHNFTSSKSFAVNVLGPMSTLFSPLKFPKCVCVLCIQLHYIPYLFRLSCSNHEQHVTVLFIYKVKLNCSTVSKPLEKTTFY